MTCMVVLLTLLIQRWLGVELKKPDIPWFNHYLSFIRGHCQRYTWWDGFGGLLAVLLPMVIIYMLLAFLLLAAVSEVIYFLVSLVILWYYVDAVTLSGQVGELYPRQLLCQRYQRIFALIFWMVILGPLGVVVYAEALRWVAPPQGESQPVLESALRTKFEQLVMLLDWLPDRLLGFTFALLGDFSAILTAWRAQVFAKVECMSAGCGLMAIGLAEQGSEANATIEQCHAIDQLVSRSLFVWLAVLALFTLGHWWS